MNLLLLARTAHPEPPRGPAPTGITDRSVGSLYRRGERIKGVKYCVGRKLL